MNESLNDSIVNYILHKQYPLDLKKKVDKFVLRRTAKKYLVRVTPAVSNDQSLDCKSVCTIIHGVSNNSLPANILNLLLYPTQVHSYNTRFSATGSFNIKYSRTNELKNSFSIFGARVWNSIPQSIRILPKHNINLKFLCIRSFYVFWNWRIPMLTHLL